MHKPFHAVKNWDNKLPLHRGTEDLFFR